MDNKSEFLQAHPTVDTKEAPSEKFRTYKAEPKRKLAMAKKIVAGVIAAAGILQGAHMLGINSDGTPNNGINTEQPTPRALDDKSQDLEKLKFEIQDK